MAKRPKAEKPAAKARKRPIEQYDHRDKKRVNNPPVGLVTPQTDPPAPSKKIYDYDPHLDPQLVWAGKKEHTSFEVPIVSLHVHERIDPRTIMEAVRKRNGNGIPAQGSLFETREENPPLREAIDFYQHAHGWSNRLIAGDSLLVMNSLLEKEGMAGQVQMVYIDPPYGIKYGSNFQPFVNKRDVKDGKDEDLTQEPEMIRAFRDTWELGIHSYLSYLRDRLLLARELLNESGSCFVQINDENLHVVRNLMDDVFGKKNFSAQISFSKAAGGLKAANRVGSVLDYLVWYFRDAEKAKYRPLFERKRDPVESNYTLIELLDGKRRPMTEAERNGAVELPARARPFMSVLMTKPGPGAKFTIEYEGRKYDSGNRWWGTTREGIANVIRAKRVIATEASLRFLTYFDDFPFRAYTNLWGGMGGAADPIYVVQTNPEVLRRCILMTTDPGDLVFDPTCGSGTTGYVAELWGRRWVTCDTSRVSVALAKQRLMSAVYDYYELAHAEEGVGSGFRYKTVPHVTLKSIANNEPAGEETLYDQPYVDKGRARVTGPFTVEAVPAPTVRSLEEIEEGAVAIGTGRHKAQESLADFRHAATPLLDTSVARKGATLRHTEWRDELLKTGIRGKGGQMIAFSRVEPLGGTRWLHADAETKEAKPQRVVVSFGPEFAPLEQRQVEMAWEEARTLIPRPAMIVFAAFQFDPEAAKDIDELTKEKTGMTFLTAQMNGDLLTEDLKKKRTSNQSFWLIGRPDVGVRRATAEEAKKVQDAGLKPGATKGGTKNLYVAEVRGFDYYNTRTGTIESGDTKKIAMWLLDTDYDGRSLYPRQVFFPLADDDEGWARLARNLKAEIDTERIEAYRGTVSLPFEPGEHKRIAVKVIDDRGIESLKIAEVG